MSITRVVVAQQMSASEEFTTAEQPNASSAAERTLSANAINLSATLNATSTPKVDKPAIYRKHTFVSGVKITIDLTAAPGLKSPDSATRAIDLTGAKLTHIQIRAGTGNNAAGVLVAFGSATPYSLFGPGGFVTLLPGEVCSHGFNGVASTKETVSASLKLIDITPGATGDVIEIEMAFGT